jgi:hypothetical protein
MLIGTQTWAWGYFSGQIWELEDTLATRVSSSPFFAPSSLLGWIRNDLVQKSCFSASDCFPLSSKDDLSQPATEVSLRSTSWISLQNPTFSLIAEICTMSEKGRGCGKYIQVELIEADLGSNNHRSSGCLPLHMVLVFSHNCFPHLRLVLVLFHPTSSLLCGSNMEEDTPS